MFMYSHQINKYCAMCTIRTLVLLVHVPEECIPYTAQCDVRVHVQSTVFKINKPFEQYSVNKFSTKCNPQSS